MRLVIVESPKKARTIKGFLGPGYRVGASMGHVRDLPPKALGIDIERDFAPEYVVLPRAKAALTLLRRAAAGAEHVLLATDPDREGEAIAWHLAAALRLPKGRYRRITFHEISRRAVQDALASPRDLDPHLIDAQQARRVLDRLVGYQLSPLLWRKVQRGTSAGRVQSVAVRLVVEREREIDAFVPEEYWTIDVQLSPEPSSGAPTTAGRGAKAGQTLAPAGALSFLARLHEVDGQKAELPDAEAARLLAAELWDAAYRVRQTAQKTTVRQPDPPFTTSTLQQVAGNRLHFPARKTMAAAQALYEAGLVTYMRTDSVAVAAEAIAQARRVIAATFGEEYLPEAPRRYTTKTRNAQEAHEAIRPVDVAKAPPSLRRSLPPDEWRVYDLIWRRMLASQMVPARYLVDSAVIDAAYPARPTEGALGAWPSEAQTRRRFTLRAQAIVLTFPGWLAAHGGGALDPGSQADGPANERLPTLHTGQPLHLEDVLPAQHFTQPPPRYTEASLVKALEEAGVGRPSTYATVVSTIQDRGYVRLEQRHFLPTELGGAANDFLVAHFPRIVDLPFTAQMEDALDEIARGRLEWTQMLRAFYGPFAETLARARSSGQSALKLQEGAAAERPKARRQRPEGRGGGRAAAAHRPSGRARAGRSTATCPECGKPLVERRSQFGPFTGCSGYPACRYIQRADGQARRASGL